MHRAPRLPLRLRSHGVTPVPALWALSGLAVAQNPPCVVPIAGRPHQRPGQPDQIPWLIRIFDPASQDKAAATRIARMQSNRRRHDRRVARPRTLPLQSRLRRRAPIWPFQTAPGDRSVDCRSFRLATWRYNCHLHHQTGHDPHPASIAVHGAGSTGRRGIARKYRLVYLGTSARSLAFDASGRGEMSDVSTMKRADFLGLLEGLLEQPGGALSGPEELEALGWDSLKGLEFLVLVDENFGGYQVSPEQLAEVRCIDDL